MLHCSWKTVRMVQYSPKSSFIQVNRKTSAWMSKVPAPRPMTPEASSTDTSSALGAIPRYQQGPLGRLRRFFSMFWIGASRNTMVSRIEGIIHAMVGPLLPSFYVEGFKPHPSTSRPAPSQRRRLTSPWVSARTGGGSSSDSGQETVSCWSSCTVAKYPCCHHDAEMPEQ